MELQKLSANQIQNSSINGLKNVKKEESRQERPQLKENCSSKASQALRGMVLGLALAAGVAASKGMVVHAANNNTPASDNNIAVTQEVEQNTQTSEVEKMADELLGKEQSCSTLYIGGNPHYCKGEMIETRNYNNAQITDEGQLVFLDKETNYRYESGYQINDGTGYIKDFSHYGKYEYCTTLNEKETYYVQNSFELGAEANGSIINLQPGTRFYESAEKNGDYVELAEDGTTFNVYDSAGNQIGSCQFSTADKVAEGLEKGLKGIGIATGAFIGAAGIGTVIATKRN